MPFQIESFSDVDTPFFNPVQDHAPVGTSSPFVASIGGYYNRNGGNEGRPESQTIPVTGVVWGEDTFLTDDDSDTFTSDGSDFWLVGDDATMLRSQLQALRDKVRKEGVLWRKRLDGSEVREWKTATLTRMSQPQTVQDRVFKAHVTCEFATDMTNWHAEEAVTYSAAAVGGVAAELVVENPGATVYDAVLSIACTSGTITSLAVACAALGIDWSRASTSIAAGQTLVIDAGRQTMLKDGADHYSLVYGSHQVAGWFPIQEGSWTFTITLGSGNATATLSLYPQFP